MFHNFKAIVGTSERLIYFDGKKDNTIYKGEFYGISFDDNHIYACERIPNGKTNIILFDKNLSVVDKCKINCSHVHQAYYDPMLKRLLIAHTRQDEMIVWNTLEKKKESVQKWTQTDGKKDYCHFNSVWRDLWGDLALYIYEHDLKADRDGVKNQLGGIRHLSADFSTKNTWPIADKGHNIYVQDNEIFVLDSNGQFCLAAINKKTHEKRIVLSTKHYDGYAPRGLAISDELILVGLTKLASRMKRRRPDHKGFIVCFDRNTKEEIGSIEIDSIGQLYEIRFLDRVDYAHNGIVFLK